MRFELPMRRARALLASLCLPILLLAAPAAAQTIIAVPQHG
jgi:hypothetical protein